VALRARSVARWPPVNCPLCEDERFVCEKHPENPWPHDDCAGPGLQCPVCQDPDARPELPAGWRSIASTEDSSD
jgi:hypothetical protein